MIVLSPPLGSALSTAGFLDNSLRYVDRLERMARSRTVEVRGTKKTHVKKNGNSFHIIMDVFKKQQCSEPVDRIWAILGLLPKELREHINNTNLIDYSVSGKREYWRSYVAFMRLLCTLDRKSFWTAVLAGQGLVKHSAMPSWCPDWNALRSYSVFKEREQFRAGFLNLYEPYEQEGPQISPLPELSLLSLSGFKIDTVRSVTRPAGGRPSSAQLAAESDSDHWQWIHQCCPLVDVVHGSSQHSTECFAQTLLVQDFSKNVTESGRETWRSTIAAVSSARSACSRGETAAMADVPPSFFSLTSNSRGRKFFNTIHGRIGIGPLDMRTDDTICVIRRARSLLVLRAVPQVNNDPCYEAQLGKYQEQFELVGDAFIYGLMKGEAFEATSRGADRNFTIV